MKKYILPPLVLGVSGIGAWVLIAMKQEPKRSTPPPNEPVVEFIIAERKTQRVFVDAFGTVRPRTSTTLLAESPGLIEAVAPFAESNRSGPQASFRAGGFFEKGDLLVSIEDIDHRAVKADAEAYLQTTQLQLAQERALSEQAKAEWELDRDWTDAPELVKRLPQIRKAEADAKAAEARLAQASRNLQRASVRAPFRGRVLETMADVGQRVGGGTSAALAKVYALDMAEIDLSLSRSELDLLNFGEGANGFGEQPEVQLLNKDQNFTHRGILDRSEGTVDPRTRLTNVVAEIEGAFADPYSTKKPNSPPPLSLGEFVEARLFGPNIEVFEIPRSAFREKNTLLIIDDENLIETRNVLTLKQTRDFVWVTEGLQNNERVCLTPLDIVSKGMKVRLASDQEQSNSTQP
jgi:RND family efflux transporter MFP subunit